MIVVAVGFVVVVPSYKGTHHHDDGNDEGTTKVPRKSRGPTTNRVVRR
jgi:hypothetical protein